MKRDTKRQKREAEVSKVKQKEGSGTVPNVTDHDGDDPDGEQALKKAVHDLEEEKGDWSKGRG